MGLARVHFTVCFGPEQHFKNAVDGMFGWLRGALNRGTEKEIVESIPDLIKVLREDSPPPKNNFDSIFFLNFDTRFVGEL